MHYACMNEEIMKSFQLYHKNKKLSY